VTGLLARIRDLLATAPASVSSATPGTTPETTPDPAPEAEAPHREHLYGSVYRVCVPFDELMAERGRTGTAGHYRRSLTPSDTERQREAAGRGRDVLWPSEAD
jgi:hypothetical protein